MRFHLDQKRPCSCCCSFQKLRVFALRLLRIRCLRLALLLMALSRFHLPIFLQLLAALGCRTNKAWGLPQRCRVMLRRRLLSSASSGRFELDPSSSRPTFLCSLFLFFRRIKFRRSGVAKYRVSEQEDIGEHVCSLRFVNELFIPKRTVLEELSSASYHLYYTSRL